MSVIQLNSTFLKELKRSLRDQCSAGSVHLTEAIALGCGYSTQAALKAALNGGAEGRYVLFDETKFRQRLLTLSGTAGPRTIEIPPLAASARYVGGVFEDPAIQIVEAHPSRARFRLTGIDTLIEIDLDYAGNGYTRFKRSHAIKTPTQAGPYWPSRDFDEDPAYAMHRAIESLVDYYREAVRAGHTPASTWLVESPYN
ncbi:hypothetical protein ACWGS9_29415 [Bradyrhizobium sp. Arg314]